MANPLDLIAFARRAWETTNQPLRERATILPLGQYEDGSVGLAWPGMLADPVQRGYQAANTPIPAINDDEAWREKSAAMFDVTSLAPLGGVLGAAENAVGIFGGRLAKTADQGALARAEKLAAEGAPREQIWNDTGWFQGVDGKWRFEIDDSKAAMNPMGQTLADTLTHDDLFGAYPSLAKIATRDGVSMGKAHYSKGDEPSGIPPEIVMGPRAKADTLLHEAQHGVQDIEGFATGGNVAMAFGADQKGGAWPIYRDIIKKIKTPLTLDEWAASQFGGDVDAARASYKDYRKTAGKITPQIDKMAQQTAAETYYKRLAGEGEARSVQKRQNLTADERRARPPWLDYDVPEADQIIRYANAPTGSIPGLAAQTQEQDQTPALLEYLRQIGLY